MPGVIPGVSQVRELEVAADLPHAEAPQPPPEEAEPAQPEREDADPEPPLLVEAEPEPPLPEPAVDEEPVPGAAHDDGAQREAAEEPDAAAPVVVETRPRRPAVDVARKLAAVNEILREIDEDPIELTLDEIRTTLAGNAADENLIQTGLEIGAEFDAHLALDTTKSGDLPSIQGDFVFLLPTVDVFQGEPFDPTLSFDNVTLNLGSLVSKIIAPVLKKIGESNPLEPALNVLTTNVRMDLAAEYPGIHVSLVLPSVVVTEFARRALHADPQASVPVPPPPARMQSADEVAAIVAALIDHPEAEVYTQPPLHQLLKRYVDDVGAFEREQRYS